MLKVFSTRRVFEHRCANGWELCGVWLTLWARVSILRPLVEECSSTCRRDGIESSVHRGGHSRPSNCGVIMHVVIATWSWILTHFLHFFHVREPLLRWVKSIRRIFLLKAKILRVFDRRTRSSLLESKSKCRLGGFEPSRSSLILSILIVAIVPHHATVTRIPKSPRGWAKDRTLMLISLVFVMLNGLEECTSPHLDILILYWDHLVEVDCLPLVLWLCGLVIKSNWAWAERL